MVRKKEKGVWLKPFNVCNPCAQDPQTGRDVTNAAHPTEGFNHKAITSETNGLFGFCSTRNASNTCVLRETDDEQIPQVKKKSARRTSYYLSDILSACRLLMFRGNKCTRRCPRGIKWMITVCAAARVASFCMSSLCETCCYGELWDGSAVMVWCLDDAWEACDYALKRPSGQTVNYISDCECEKVVGGRGGKLVGIKVGEKCTVRYLLNFKAPVIGVGGWGKRHPTIRDDEIKAVRSAVEWSTHYRIISQKYSITGCRITS